MDSIKYWVSFQRIPGVGRARLSLLENYFGDMERAWQAPASELVAAGLEAKVVSAIVQARPRLSPDAEEEKLARFRVKALTYHHPAYPARLREIYDFPPLLYVRGELVAEDTTSLAVVGTRRPTLYGRQATEEIVADLVKSQVTIVSGLARGIDAIAHRAALQGGGRTIAVFASGLDIVYPAEHARLAQEVMERGALVSEHPLGTPPRADYFPRRNRLLSGLSLGVLVVEAGESSGALITARWALEQNREVFALPGSIFSPASRGTNRLIQEGAKLVSSYMDILEELNLMVQAPQLEMKGLIPMTETESALLRHLGAEPRHIDLLCRLSGLPIPLVSSTLSLLELKGAVKQLGPMSFVAAREAREEYRVGAG